MNYTLFAVSVAWAAAAAAASTSSAWAADPACRPKTDNQAETLCNPTDFKFICVDSAAKFGLSCPTGVGYQCALKQADCPADGSIVALKAGASGTEVATASVGGPGGAATRSVGAIGSSEDADKSSDKTSDKSGDGKIHTLATFNQGNFGSVAQPIQGLPPGSQPPVINTPSNPALWQGDSNLQGLANSLQGTESAVNGDIGRINASLPTGGNLAAAFANDANYQKDYAAYQAAATNWNGEETNAEKGYQSAVDSQKNSGDDTSSKKSTVSSSKSSDDCDVSSRLDGKMGCSGTMSMIKVGQGMNIAGQVAGSVTTQISGAEAQAQALTAGTQSSAYRGAASTAMMSGESQATLGAFNTMMGVMMMERGAKHNKNAKAINKAFQSPDGKLYVTHDNGVTWTTNDSSDTLANKAAAGGGLREVTSVEQEQGDAVDAARAKLTAAQGNAYLASEVTKDQQALKAATTQASRAISNAGLSAGHNAEAEQSKMAGQASDAGLMALMSGAQQLGQGVLAIASAKQLESAANQMAAAEAASALTLQPPAADPFPTTAARTPTIITGTSSPTPSAATADQQPTDNGVPPLGSGLPQPTDGAPNGAPIAPGKFLPAGPVAAGQGGAGGGGLSGGSTQPAPPDGAEKGPMSANPYVAGTTPVSGGMVGPAPQGAKEDRLNPSDMMAAALGLFKPKGDDGPANAQAYGRSPASSGSLNGLGLPEEDIFKIIETGYRRQIQAGNVGG